MSSAFSLSVSITATADGSEGKPRPVCLGASTTYPAYPPYPELGAIVRT